MKELCFKQEKPITVKIMGSLLLVVGLINYSDLVGSLIVLFLSLVLLGYSISYKRTKEYCNYKQYSFFGKVVFKRKIDILFPKYISLFGSSLSKPNDWGPVFALGTRSNGDRFVIRLFNEEENFTIYTSDNLIKTRKMAFELSELSVVELVDKTSE